MYCPDSFCEGDSRQSILTVSRYESIPARDIAAKYIVCRGSQEPPCIIVVSVDLEMIDSHLREVRPRRARVRARCPDTSGRTSSGLRSVPHSLPIGQAAPGPSLVWTSFNDPAAACSS